MAIAALLVADREARIAQNPEAERTDVLLAATGLSHKAIAAMVGKQEAAVRMAITRATAKPAAKGPTRKRARE